jgi:hypothetical protein
MVLTDSTSVSNPRVFRRGNPNNPGEEVPRQFLQVVAGPERKPFTRGSGRFELAQAIASKSNPLTARVAVNRVWIGHFGTGLVRTPSDFGLRSEKPVQLALLNYLADRFVQDGWSLKRLHRLILTSSAYQQSAAGDPRAANLDPDNTLLGRVGPRRLDFEAMRDSLLAASGQLDRSVGGRTVDIVNAANNRRSIYATIDRQNLPGLFRIFDFASPDTHSPQRFETTVPQQALYLMNSPFAVRMARSLVARPEVASQATDEQKLRQLYRLAYARDPSPAELTSALSFTRTAGAVEESAAAAEAPVWHYGRGSVDEARGRTGSFEPLTIFVNGNYQVSSQYPDPKLGSLRLTRIGGSPGPGAENAVIRRWVAPRDGIFAVTGALAHTGGAGDGVRGRIISSRDGVLGTWIAEGNRSLTELGSVTLRLGDTLDFVVDGRSSAENDAFMWTPTVRLVKAGSELRLGTLAGSAASATEWSAAGGFEGPAPEPPKPLGPWEKLAQVLLVSNEFMFVD